MQTRRRGRESGRNTQKVGRVEKEGSNNLRNYTFWGPGGNGKQHSFLSAIEADGVGKSLEAERGRDMTKCQKDKGHAGAMKKKTRGGGGTPIKRAPWGKNEGAYVGLLKGGVDKKKGWGAIVLEVLPQAERDRSPQKFEQNQSEGVGNVKWSSNLSQGFRGYRKRLEQDILGDSPDC